MSYDLIYRGPAHILPTVTALAHKHACESHAVDDQIVIGVGGDDESVAKLYQALVKLSLDHGGTLNDPQRGVDIDPGLPGRFPPGWEPSGAVFGKSFDAKVQSFLVDHLRPHGFTLETAWTAVRACEHLVQGVNVQPGRGRLSGYFTVKAYWTFTLRPLEVPEAMDVVVQLNEVLIAQRKAKDDAFKGWLPSKPAATLDRSFETVRRVFRDHVLPLLDEARTVDGIVRAYEAGRRDVPGAFGLYSTGQKMAECYGLLGRLEDGRRRFGEYLSALEGQDRPGLEAWIEGERARAETAFRDEERSRKQA